MKHRLLAAVLAAASLCLPAMATAKPLWREWLGWLDHKAISLSDGLISALERSRSRRQLMALDDRLLKDIGIDRATAQFEGRKSVWSSW